MHEDELESLLWDWRFWARPAQLAPEGTWTTWLILAGRGFGKTRSGAEWVRDNVCGRTPLARGRFSRIALVAETAADARDVLVGSGMGEDGSGIMQVHPPAFRPVYQSSLRRLTWPNGAVATLFNGTEPDQLRGPQHDAAWVDELAKYKYAQETFDMLQFGLRLGDNPQQLVTTTPRPIPVLREIISDPDTVVTRGSTYDNYANLSAKFIKRIVRKFEGTRQGRQELHAEVLDDVQGALWTRAMLERAKLKAHDRDGNKTRLPDFIRCVVAVDPSGKKTAEDGRDAIGIVGAGLGMDGLVYVVADRSCMLGPTGWGKRAVDLYDELKADRIVAEDNFGGAMVESVIRTVDSSVSYKAVHASRGKAVRAEPVAALYEQDRVRHLGGMPELEDEMCLMTAAGYEGSGSPNRMDAVVWAITDLMLSDARGSFGFGAIAGGH